VPFTFGAQDVTEYGALALKLNTLLRVYVVLCRFTTVNVPTAYIVESHWTIWRICSVVDVVAGKCGVEVTGVLRTGPAGVAAWVAGAKPANPSADAATTVVEAASLRWMRCNAAPRTESGAECSG